MSELKEKFNEISIWEIAEFWIETYPEDIFVTGPEIIIQIRELFKKMLTMRGRKRNE